MEDSFSRVFARNRAIGRVYIAVSLVLLVLLICLAGLIIVVLPGETTGWLLAFGLVVFPFAMVLHRRYKNAVAAYRNVEVSATQYPEVYQMAVELSERAGLKEVPPVAITLDPSIDPCRMNPGMRHSLVIGMDFLAGCREQDTPDAVRYMLAHHLGHMKFAHNRKLWIVIAAPILGTPGLKTLLTRHLEFTADAYAAYLVPEGVDSALSLCAVGKDNFPFVNTGEQLRATHRPRGLLRFVARWWSDEVPAGERMWRLHRDGLAVREHPGAG